MAAETVESIVRRSLTAKIDENAKYLKEQLVRAAVENFEVQLRRAVGNIAIDYNQFFSLHSNGAETVIHVKVDGGRL